jgi:hypothetical protein
MASPLAVRNELDQAAVWVERVAAIIIGMEVRRERRRAVRRPSRRRDPGKGSISISCSRRVFDFRRESSRGSN